MFVWFNRNSDLLIWRRERSQTFTFSNRQVGGKQDKIYSRCRLYLHLQMPRQVFMQETKTAFSSMLFALRPTFEARVLSFGLRFIQMWLYLQTRSKQSAIVRAQSRKLYRYLRVLIAVQALIRTALTNGNVDPILSSNSLQWSLRKNRVQLLWVTTFMQNHFLGKIISW